MNSPLTVAQSSLALAQSIVNIGLYPPFFGENSTIGGAVLGMIITTAFDPYGVRGLTFAAGQTLPVSQNQALYSLLGSIYGGQGYSTFALPNLAGGLTLGLPLGGDLGAFQGAPENVVALTQAQLPATLGGTSEAVSNLQYGQQLRYLIQVDGIFPGGGAITNSSLGAIFSSAMTRVPDGFMVAEGQLLSIEQNQALFAVLGTTYGGDGASTFALPDLSTAVPIGSGGNFRLGQKVGSATLTLEPDSVPNAPDAQSGVTPLSMLQPSLAVNYVINTQGEWKFLNSETPMLGQVTMYAGAYVPEGWVLAQGQELQISGNEALYALLGTQFGGDGIFTFALPDLRDRAIVGGGGPSGLPLGQVIGEQIGVVSRDNLPEIMVGVPGLSLKDDSGAVVTDKVTNLVVFNVSGVWPGAKAEFSADGIAWSTTYVANEGSNSVSVRQVDVLGQPSLGSTPLVFILDTTAPITPVVYLDTTSLAVDSDDAAVPQTSTGSLRLEGLEQATLVEYSVDGGVTWSEQFAAVLGLNTVSVKQYDRAGNVSLSSDPLVFHYLGSSGSAPAVLMQTQANGAVDLIALQGGALSAGLGTGLLTDTLYYSLQQDLTLPLDIETVRLSGIGAGNTIRGNGQENRFDVIEGSWRIDGEAGFDTVSLKGSLESYVIQQTKAEGELQVTLLGSNGKLVLTGIEQIQFTDGALSITQLQVTQDVYQLYLTSLGRNPDFIGLDFWNAALDGGSSLSVVAQDFMRAQEFQDRYGQSLTSLEFLGVAYESMLGRSPDQQGQAYWQGKLNAGASLGDVWLGVMLSEEAIAYAPANADLWLPSGPLLVLSDTSLAMG